MGAQGITEVDFGAFPGAAIATVVITGQASFDSTTSSAESWQMPYIDTTDHTVDEQLLDPLIVLVSDFSTGNGFTIYAQPPLGTGLRFGKFKIGWVWN